MTLAESDRPQGGPARSTAAATVLMVRPSRFAHNAETAATNAFQRPDARDPDTARRDALAEFERLVGVVRAAAVRVAVVDGAPDAPDAVFPNNWVSFHRDGTTVLYPMLAPSRRREVRPDLVAQLQADGFVEVRRTLDLRHHEAADGFLEGTGSLVLDRRDRVAYACRSARTSPRVLAEWAAELGYRTHVFTAVDRTGAAIYHTNVMMGIGSGFVVVCAEAVSEPRDRSRLLAALRATGRAVVEISLDQMHCFAGNLIELRAADGAPVIVMSAAAWRSFDAAQRGQLEACGGSIVAPDLATIEALGGGSARCMIAEIAW
ncbi:MAG: arginine deiminase-related protein [Planctomycetota bacterium]